MTNGSSSSRVKEKDSDSEEGGSSCLTFLDLCCGSGAIAVSLLHDNPGLRGHAIDQSEHAVALTKENARRYVLVGA
jgi:methylase of polypeptide subunit release factors